MKKLLALAMALTLCLSLLPATALAAETAGEPQAVPSPPMKTPLRLRHPAKRLP